MLVLIPETNGGNGVHGHNSAKGYFNYRLILEGDDVGIARGHFENEDLVPSSKGTHARLDMFDMRHVSKDNVALIASLRGAFLEKHPHVRSIGGLRQREREKRQARVLFRH